MDDAYDVAGVGPVMPHASSQTNGQRESRERLDRCAGLLEGAQRERRSSFSSTGAMLPSYLAATRPLLSVTNTHGSEGNPNAVTRRLCEKLLVDVGLPSGREQLFDSDCLFVNDLIGIEISKRPTDYESGLHPYCSDLRKRVPGRSWNTPPEVDPRGLDWTRIAWKGGTNVERDSPEPEDKGRQSTLAKGADSIANSSSGELSSSLSDEKENPDRNSPLKNHSALGGREGCPDISRRQIAPFPDKRATDGIQACYGANDEAQVDANAACHQECQDVVAPQSGAKY